VYVQAHKCRALCICCHWSQVPEDAELDKQEQKATLGMVRALDVCLIVG